MKRPVLLRYEDNAIADLERIVDHGVEQGFTEPAAFVVSLETRIAVLRDHPRVGRVGRMAGTRELVLPGTPYIAIYTVKADTVTVHRVLHGAQQWP